MAACDGANHWRVSTGPAPGPALPDCCAWSEDNHIAIASESVLRVVLAGSRMLVWKLNRAEALKASDDDEALNAKGAGVKRSRHAEARPSLLCLPQPHAQPFVAVSWSPLAVAPARGSLLCAAIGHACTIYARPQSPYRLQPDAVVQLSPLLHAALGHAMPPAAEDRSTVDVHSSCWSSLVVWGDDASPTCDAPLRRPTPCCYLALGGPSLLAVVAHASASHQADHACWSVALALDSHLPPGGVTHVHFGPQVGSQGTAGVRVSRLQLFTGGAEGSVLMWHLSPPTATQATASTDGVAPSLECMAVWQVGGAPVLTRRIGSISSTALSDDSLESDPTGDDATRDDVRGRGGTGRSAIKDRGCILAVGCGSSVCLYQLEPIPEGEVGGAAVGGTALSDSAQLAGPQAQLTRRGAHGQLVHCTTHASEITSVLCLPPQWFAAATDGAVLRGPLDNGARVDGDARGEGLEGAPRSAGLPCDPTTPPVSLVAYPQADEPRQEADGESAIAQWQMGARGTPRNVKLVPGERSSAAAAGRPSMGGTGEEREDEPSALTDGVVFGLSGAPVGGGLAICVRGASRRAGSRSGANHADGWKLAISTPPPSAPLLPLPRRHPGYPPGGHADGPGLFSTGRQPADASTATPAAAAAPAPAGSIPYDAAYTALVAARRPLGASLWSVGASLHSAAPEVRRSLLLFALSRARTLSDMMADPAANAVVHPPPAQEASLRELQLLRALATECATLAAGAGERKERHQELAPAPVPEPVPVPTPALAPAPTAPNESSTSTDAERLDGTLDEISELCARALLRAQAASVVVAAASAGVAPLGSSSNLGEISAPLGSSSHRAPSADVLPSAAWLLALLRAERRRCSSQAGIQHSASTRPLTTSLAACLRAAGGSELDAVMAERLRDGGVDDDEASDGRSSTSDHDVCLICTQPVPVTVERTAQLCASGHPTLRCWVCFKLLPLNAWSCGTCGAGSCSEHDDAPCGVLCTLSPAGTCGLCGSPCAPPTRAPAVCFRARQQ